MRNFFQKHEKVQLESFLVQCLHEKVEFCFSLRKIPSKDFEERFRDQFSSEFQQLENAENHDEFSAGYYAGSNLDRAGSFSSASTPLSRRNSINGNLLDSMANLPESAKINEADPK